MTPAGTRELQSQTCLYDEHQGSKRDVSVWLLIFGSRSSSLEQATPSLLVFYGMPPIARQARSRNLRLPESSGLWHERTCGQPSRDVSVFEMPQVCRCAGFGLVICALEPATYQHGRSTSIHQHLPTQSGLLDNTAPQWIPDSALLVLREGSPDLLPSDDVLRAQALKTTTRTPVLTPLPPLCTDSVGDGAHFIAQTDTRRCLQHVRHIRSNVKCNSTNLCTKSAVNSCLLVQ